jgi:hypothetical protein
MSDVLEQKINENEESYNSVKKDLENKIGVANGDYSSLLKDFNSQIGYIQNNTMLSKEGKDQQTNELRNSFTIKAKAKSLDHFAKLQLALDDAINTDQLKRVENYKIMTAESMPQLMYVSTMVNQISSFNDVDLLEDVFKYASEGCNFSDELINMVHIKARNLINNHVNAEIDVNTRNSNTIQAAMKIGNDRTKIQKIISKIDNYKKNYNKEFTDLKSSFARAVNQGKYPSSLYIQRDIKADFGATVDSWKNIKNI